MVAFPPHTPICCRYSRHMAPVSARDPAKANPNPSRIDFLPSSITSGGMSAYFVVATKRPTYSVRPGVLGKSLAEAAPEPGAARAGLTRAVEAIAPKASFPKSRRNISYPPFLEFTSGCILCHLESSDRCGEVDHP